MPFPTAFVPSQAAPTTTPLRSNVLVPNVLFPSAAATGGGPPPPIAAAQVQTTNRPGAFQPLHPSSGIQDALQAVIATPTQMQQVLANYSPAFGGVAAGLTEAAQYNAQYNSFCPAGYAMPARGVGSKSVRQGTLCPRRGVVFVV